MSALIEIKKELIGAENINSVNSRELWNNLEVKKPFSDWIKFQINSLSLEQNIDYLLVSQKSEAKGRGGNRKEIFDYIITLDTAKHIAMASRTEKGKEVRKYFIEAEKKLNQLQPQEQNILPVLVEMAKVNQMLVQSNQEIVANLTNMNAGLHEMLSTMHNIKQDTSRLKKDVDRLEKSNTMDANFIMGTIRRTFRYLNPIQIDAIRKSIDKRAEELSNGSKTNIQSIKRAIYSYINSEYDITSYYHIPQEEILNAIEMIENININIGAQNA
uniref:antA/AntB antirepressor family protein n=1 Tax=Aliarcobacter sp. TaxID=2321116 RepID=UPI00404839BE